MFFPLFGANKQGWVKKTQVGWRFLLNSKQRGVKINKGVGISKNLLLVISEKNDINA